MAHPDDAEIRCFGTILKYIDFGYRVRLIIVCDGENGISIAEKEEFGITKINNSIRIKETENAFSSTPVEIKVLDGFVDGNLQLNSSLIMTIERELREFEPEILITHYPDGIGVDHQDHFVVGKAAINCASRNELVKKILLAEPLLTLRSSFSSNYYVDITDYLDAKISALSHHKSQSGRFYLENEFHKIRSSYYASMVGYNFVREKHHVESFQMLYQFE
ncbi:PIG-L deacetylase family protein [Paenibacillus polymyxa]|nr:PIG-L deacetylase family protein [Paenibacillus polymyxa]MDY7989857.1 PIG-L deacetylase family protein [Paenibacillus polymyxa]